MALGLLGLMDGSDVRAAELTHLRLLGSPLDEQPPSLIGHDAGSVTTGIFIVQDKSKGVTWFLNPAKGMARAVELPFNNGNHESALLPDGLTLPVPIMKLW